MSAFQITPNTLKLGLPWSNNRLCPTFYGISIGTFLHHWRSAEHKHEQGQADDDGFEEDLDQLFVEHFMQQFFVYLVCPRTNEGGWFSDSA